MRAINKIIILLFIVPSILLAEDLPTTLKKLSDDLSASIVKSGSKKVSVLDFTDLEGRNSEFGRFLAEQLSVSLVNSTKTFVVVDRANMNSILAEHKLTASGLVNPENAKKLGQFSGVDAIIIGNVTKFGDTISITVKAISTETSEILAATMITTPRSGDIDAMLLPDSIPKGQAAIASGDNASQTDAVSKDFMAPNGSSIFNNATVEIMSFKIAGPDSILALVKVTNTNKTSPIKIGLNRTDQGITGTFLVDDNGDIIHLADTSGIMSIKDMYSQTTSTFQTLKEHLSLELLNKMSDINVGQSILFTLTFSNSGHTISGSNFRLNSEIIVAEMASHDRVGLALNNVVISGIHPNK